MAFTQAQHDALQEAISQGVMRVKYADKEITYMTLQDMRSLLNQMKNELGTSLASKTSLFGVKTYVDTDKGL